MLQWIATIKNIKKQKTVATVGILLLSVFCFGIFLFGFDECAKAVEEITISAPGGEIQEGLEIIEEPLGLPSTDIRTIIANIIRAAFALLGTVLVVIIIYGGFLYMTSGGNEEQIGRAKDILKNAVIGLAIILSAYSIVWFIMRMLGVGPGVPSSQTISLEGYQNFRGSGALGRIVKDHYPVRNQEGVYRNTKIVITFKKPVDPSSFIDNVNNSYVDLDLSGNKNGDEPEIFGDCVDLDGDGIDWETDCDSLKLDNEFINVIPGIENYTFSGATVLAPTSTDPNTQITGVYTIVIRPYSFLGSDLEDVPYKVHLGPGIKLDDEENDNPSAFTAAPGYYEWQFTCGTEVDLTPPYVKSTWPRNLRDTPKNTVIQVEFNEAIDPIGLQGVFSEVIGSVSQEISPTPGKQYFKLTGNNVFLKNGDEMLPVGNMNLTGGYKILEFTPTELCGTNACGGQVFCLPVAEDENPNTNVEVNNYDLVLKSASVSNDDSWEGDAFTGIMDMASNALDGNHDGIIQHATTTMPVFNEWKEADNFNWNFNVKNVVDLTPPFLKQVYPGLDGEDIKPKQEWGFVFSKRMRIDSLYNIGITEYPSPVSTGVDGQCAILKTELEKLNEKTGSNIDTNFECVYEQLWKVVKDFKFTPNGDNEQTEVIMGHGKFLDKIRQYYFPFATSTVEDVNFNCFYPGKGPGDSDSVTGVPAPLHGCTNGAWTAEGCRPSGEKIKSLICDGDTENCNGATTSTPNLQFGCNGVVGSEVNSLVSCTDVLKLNSPHAGSTE